MAEREAIIERAVQVIGEREKAMRWLGTPMPALGYQTPMAVMGQPDGGQQVLTILGRLEHGLT